MRGGGAGGRFGRAGEPLRDEEIPLEGGHSVV